MSAPRNKLQRTDLSSCKKHEKKKRNEVKKVGPSGVARAIYAGSLNTFSRRNYSGSVNGGGRSETKP